MPRDVIDLQRRRRPSPEQLPGLLREIAEVAGIDAAVAVAEAKGGIRVHFPTKADDDHWLVRAAGREAADKLCRHFKAHNAGISLDVPTVAAIRRLHLHQAVRDMRAAGTSVSNTARALGVSERTVYKWSERNS